MKRLNKPSAATVERLLLALSLVSVCVLAFVAGTLMMHYRPAALNPLVNALEAGEAWVEDLGKPAPAAARGSLKEAVENASVQWNLKGAQEGYTLMTTWAGSEAYLVDMNGAIKHRWAMPFSKVWPNPTHIRRSVPDSHICWEAAYLYPNGDLLAIYISINQTPYGFGMVKLNKRSKVLWSYAANTHHDLYVDKGNGNIYALVQELVNTPIPGLEALHYPIMTDSVVTLSPQGKEIGRIPLMDAFLDSPYSLLLYHSGNWDYFHSNSVMKLEPEMAAKFPQFKPGQILVSVRNFGTLAVVDPDTKKVVWATRGMWRGQHAAHFLPDGDILLLDNKGHQIAGETYSRVIEYNPRTLGIDWHYAGNEETQFFTNILGRVQRLSNGNTLITEGTRGRIFEVTPDGKVVWDFTLPPLEKKKRGHKRSAEDSVVIASALRYRPDELQFLRNP